MTTSLETRIRRMFGVLVGVAAIVLVGAGSAFAGDRPAARYYTKQQLETMSQSWAAKAALSMPASPERTALLRSIVASNTPKTGSDRAGGRPAASYYTKQQLEAMSERWAIKAALDSLTPTERQALLQGAAQTTAVRNSSGRFDRGDFAIGAAGMLGLVLLVGGALGAARFGRHHAPRFPARHAPA